MQREWLARLRAQCRRTEGAEAAVDLRCNVDGGIPLSLGSRQSIGLFSGQRRGAAVPLSGGRRTGGPALVQKIAELCSETRLLFISGYTDDEIISRGLASPGMQLQQKPFSAQ